MATSRSVPCSVNATDPDVVTAIRTTEGGTRRVANRVSVVATVATTNTTPGMIALVLPAPLMAVLALLAGILIIIGR
jgi:hypothetical protein